MKTPSLKLESDLPSGAPKVQTTIQLPEEGKEVKCEGSEVRVWRSGSKLLVYISVVLTEVDSNV